MSVQKKELSEVAQLRGDSASELIRVEGPERATDNEGFKSHNNIN